MNVAGFFHISSGMKWYWKTGISMAIFCLLVPFAMLCFLPKPQLMEELDFGGMVLAANGELLKLDLDARDKYRIRISLEDVSPLAIKYLLEYEDKYFYSHPGVNPFSMARAALANLAGGRRYGASTITMQVARLRYGLKTSNLHGKIAQIWQALHLEWHYSKQDILEAYFNLAPYGGNIEGIEAAARIYFNKPASHLTDSEAIALTVVPQNPVARNPVTGGDFDRARLKLAFSMSNVSTAHTMSIMHAPLKTEKPSSLPFVAPHLSLELLKRSQGGVIHSFIEKDLQVMLEKALRNFSQRGKRYGVENAAAMLVDSRNMRVCALAGSASFFNSRISGQIDGSNIRRSPGSTLKPFIYAMALDQGLIHPMSILPDSPRSFGGYDPGNYDRNFRGPLAAHEALKSSRNLPAISLTEKLAYPGLYGFLVQSGAKLVHDADYYGLALALGGAEITMRELAAMYAMLANNGLCQSLLYEKNDFRGLPSRLLSPEAAWLVLWMLAREDASIISNGKAIPLYYKTGTSNGLRDAWTAGLAGEYVLIVWVGNFDNSHNPSFTGAGAALPLFQEIAQALGSRRVLHDVLARDTSHLNIDEAMACISTGDFDNGHCGPTVPVKFIPGISPVKDSGILRPILIDRKTGLRACKPGDGIEEIWWEFWPTDLKGIFANAGIYKPDVPEWMPECAMTEKDFKSSGNAPRIMLPKKNVIYQRGVNQTDFRIPLQAAADPDVNTVHWYANSTYLGHAAPGEIIFWEPDIAGKFEITALDNSGRSGKQACQVVTVP